MVAVVIEHDREGLAPIALPTEQPVAQPELHRALAVVCLLQPFDRFLFCVGDVQAVKKTTVHSRPVAEIRFAVKVGGRLDGANDGQLERLGEVPVPLVLSGHGHDRARAVAHQDIVGDPYLDPLTGGGVRGIDAGEHAGLVLGFRYAIDVGAAQRLGDIVGQCRDRSFRARLIQNLLHKRMFRRDDHVGCAEDRVSARGENAQPVETDLRGGIDQSKIDVSAFAAPDPLLLHGARRLGPIQIL